MALSLCSPETNRNLAGDKLTQCKSIKTEGIDAPDKQDGSNIKKKKLKKKVEEEAAVS